jgi:hypothetical protein
MSDGKRTEPSGWNDLVYNLFYPSILGSIIFDYLDPIRFGDVDRLFLYAVPLVFVADYWHMKNTIRAHISSRPMFRAIDIIVTLVFLASYYSFSGAFTRTPPDDALPVEHEYLLLLGFLMMVGALILVLLYDWLRCGRTQSTPLWIATFVLVTTIGAICFHHYKAGHGELSLWFRIWSSVLAAEYMAYVAWWSVTASRCSDSHRHLEC